MRFSGFEMWALPDLLGLLVVSLPLVVRVDADDTCSADNLKTDGYREGDLLVTYWRERAFWRPVASVRLAKPGDRERVVIIANCAFNPKDKGAWVLDAFNRDDRTIYVDDASSAQTPNAFLITRVEHPDTLVVDLIGAVIKKGGSGRRLIETAEWLNGCRYTQAGTQENNTVARQFYAALGFTIKHRRRTFHKP